MALTVGLRFSRHDAAKLRALADRATQVPALEGSVGLFKRAAIDAALGEAMRVECQDLDEARTLAAGFTLYGVSAPTVEAFRT